jgi:hypothetical protein
MKKIIIISLIFSIILPNIARSEATLTGRILLQVEEKGQAWYISPADEKRYSLGRPNDAFDLMRKLSIGISNKDLEKIPIGFQDNNYLDSDADGIYDNLENTIGTNKNNKDTDSDGYDDKTELINEHNPLGAEKLPIDKKFTQINSGKIFLQVEKNGEAWYVDPVTQKRYFLGRPADAFQIMRAFGLGITNANLEKITIGLLTVVIAPDENILQSVATAIRTVDTQKTLTYFTANMHKSIEYSMQNMGKENLLLLANILSASTLRSSTENKKTYFNEIYFQGEKHLVYFYVEKQTDGTWLMSNL